MNKAFVCACALLLSISFLGCASETDSATPPQMEESDEATVESLVKEFGSRIQMVALLGPEDQLRQSMEENYGDFVSLRLLQKWQGEPETALGRLTSSPWPDRIEITSTARLSDDEYEVNGNMIEITSAEKESGGIAAQRPISLIVKKMEDRWLIDDVEVEDYEAPSIVYWNTDYGFIFYLPETWDGYSILSEDWTGTAVAGPQPGGVVESGPMLFIRHPGWTEENQRQDIPIMVFTVSQWDTLQKGEFSVSAAPVGPTELDRNVEYVFALPARYNYAFPTGYEEVECILEGDPLRAD